MPGNVTLLQNTERLWFKVHVKYLTVKNAKYAWMRFILKWIHPVVNKSSGTDCNNGKSEQA